MVVPPNFIEAYKWYVKANVINNSGWGRTSTFWSNSPAAAGHFVCQSWKRFVKLGQCTPDMSYLHLFAHICTSCCDMLWVTYDDIWSHDVTCCCFCPFLGLRGICLAPPGARSQRGWGATDMIFANVPIWWLVHHSGAFCIVLPLCVLECLAVFCLYL